MNQYLEIFNTLSRLSAIGADVNFSLSPDKRSLSITIRNEIEGKLYQSRRCIPYLELASMRDGAIKHLENLIINSWLLGLEDFRNKLNKEV